MGKATTFSPKVCERAVRLVFEQVNGDELTWPAIVSVAAEMTTTELTLDALDQALWARCRVSSSNLPLPTISGQPRPTLARHRAFPTPGCPPEGSKIVEKFGSTPVPLPYLRASAPSMSF